jgi:prolycopene isomerase
MFPGFRDHITHIEVATPWTLSRYSQSEDGAIYGWENNPAQAGSQRLSHVTPLPGLYLSGHWTLPGTGSVRVMYSGLQTAQIILGFATTDELLGAMFARAGRSPGGPPVTHGDLVQGERRGA